MAKSEMEQIGYEAGLRDMLDYVNKVIDSSMGNDALNIIPARMALQVLKASLTVEDFQ